MLDCLSQSSCSDRVMEGRVSAGVRPKSVLKGNTSNSPTYPESRNRDSSRKGERKVLSFLHFFFLFSFLKKKKK